MFPMIITLLFASAAFCGWHEARDKRRSSIWPVACFCFPPIVLLLMVLPRLEKDGEAESSDHVPATGSKTWQLRSIRS